jgi:hypothetical protein
MTILIEIFRAGRHTAANGATVEFSEADIAAIARNYRPSLHEAPVVLGHPKDNAPAYGWADSLRARGPHLQAALGQVEPAFSESVKTGRWKKVSASFYAKDSPANPTPGQYYLRHIGFLGAQPPAVKGLAAVQFAEGDIGEKGCVTIEFAEATVSTDAEAAAAGAADQIVKDASVKLTDAVTATVLKLVVARVLADIVKAFPDLDKAKAETTITEATTAALATPPEGQTEGTALQAAIATVLAGAAVEAPIQEAISAATPAAATADGGASLDHSEASSPRERELKRREAALQANERRMRRTEHETFLRSVAAEGKRLPFQRADALDLLERVSSGDIISFAEAGQTTTVERVKSLISALPKVVDFNELSGGEISGDDPLVVARAAQDYQSEQESKGNHVSTSEAVRHVKGMR